MNVEDVFFTIARDIKQRLAETDSKPEVHPAKLTVANVSERKKCLLIELRYLILQDVCVYPDLSESKWGEGSLDFVRMTSVTFVEC